MSDNKIKVNLGGQNVTFKTFIIRDFTHLKQHSFRCVDGRYTNTDAKEGLIAFPGAVPGLMAVLFATLRTLGEDTTYDLKLVKEIFVDLIGGVDEIDFHTDDHNLDFDNAIPAKGCGHLKLIRNNYQKYMMFQKDIDLIDELLREVKAGNTDNEVVLEGSHEEKAVLTVRGNVGVGPRGKMEDGREMQVFVFNEYSLFILKAIAQNIIERGVIHFKDGEISAEDFAGMMAEMAVLHLSLTVSSLAPLLPVYRLDFTKLDSEGNPKFEIFGALGDEGRIEASTLFE